MTLLTRRQWLELGGLALLGSSLTRFVPSATADSSDLPEWITFPDDEWRRITSAQAGFDGAKWEAFLRANPPQAGDWQGEDHSGNRWGIALTRGGYLVQTWGDPDYAYQTASLGKAFSWALVGLAVADGLIDADAPVHQTWTGEGLFSHDHKRLDHGHHRALTWRHLLEHRGGFPVTNGYFWRRGESASVSAYPDWANPTGDPLYDSYAHIEPGRKRSYSSSGYWRLTQALTALWENDLKAVMDERVFRHIGVSSDEWDWLSGKTVHDDREMYPAMPGYGDFIDPPYEVNGNTVRGGPGWVVMSARNLVRYGHLIATGGVWKGKRLVPAEWIRGHAGGNHSLVQGDPKTRLAVGVVTAKNAPYPAPEGVIVGPVKAP